MTPGPGALVAIFLASAAAEGAPSRACDCPCSEQAGDHPFRRPAPAAFQLNREGRDLYRQRQWAAARNRYQAARQADPAFLGPLLNLACAHAQEGRFSDAVAVAVELAGRAYVPWAEEIRQAADLAPLAARPELKSLQAALAEAGRRWGQELGEEALLFVARRGPPVRLPAAGVLHLGLEQEVLAWLPRSGAYRQVTAEQGGVLGFVRSRDGRKVDYVRAGRLVREPGVPDRLRALTLRRLDLPSMVSGPPVEIPGDVVQAQLLPLADGTTAVRIIGPPGTSDRRFDGRSLLPVPAGTVTAAGALRLTARGVEAPAAERVSAPCAYTARDERSAGPPAIRIRRPGKTSFALEAPFGAGLRGLPFP